MTSLSEVYEPDAEFQTSLRRLYAGIGLFLLGAAMVIGGLLAATTGMFAGADAALWQERELGGILAGLGVPAIFIGIFTVLPASRRTRGAAIIGSAVAVLGVALFVHAYPCQWSGSNCGEGLLNLTLPVALTYSVGAFTTFWCLFAGVANFKSRNSPGGTAQVEVTAQGETRVIEVPKSELAKFSGSMGVLGNTPDPDAETQTNRPGAGGSGNSSGSGGSSGPMSDGGATTNQVQEVTGDDAIVERTTRPDSPSASQNTGRNTGGSKPQSDGSSRASDEGADVFRTGSSGAEPSNGGTGSQSPGGQPAGAGADRSPKKSGDWTPSGQAAPATNQTSGADRDRYCGTCEHFQYVRTENGMQPYCGAHDEVMDDMDACEQYENRTGN